MPPPRGRLSVNVHRLDYSMTFCTNEFVRRIFLKMRTIDLDSLEIFRAVMREGGFRVLTGRPRLRFPCLVSVS